MEDFSSDTIVKNFWYVASPYEIMVDMDKPKTSLPHVEMRLRAAIKDKLLDVQRIELHRSFNDSHLHMLVTLRDALSPFVRAIWGLMLHSDVYRACHTMMRALSSIPSPDLLISPMKFLRNPDAVCTCDSKHTGPVMDVCPVAIMLRGEWRCASFFGRPGSEERMFPNGDLDVFDYNQVWEGRDFS